MDICKKAACIFEAINMDLQKNFANDLYNRLRTNVRNKLIDFGTMTASGNCQTTQAMAIFYDVFDNGEKPTAFNKLLKLIEQKNGHIDTGILGARVIFHVLTKFGKSDLAFEVITTPTFPSYGNCVARGATSLWEIFIEECWAPGSLNHHFFGDISGWFIKCVSGININPFEHDVNEVHIKPSFIESLSHAKGYHIAPSGKIEVEWKREDAFVNLIVTVPEKVTGKIILQDGYVFDDGFSEKVISSGVYKILKI